MNPAVASTLTKLRKQLDAHGALLLTDPALPSLTTIVAGEPVKGSWWGHPKGGLMYNLSNELMDEPGVLTVKLVNKKTTFLLRRHWDALVAIAGTEAPWQLRGLPAPARALWRAVSAKGEVRADDPAFRRTAAETGKLASKLEERLLIHSESLHTDSGKHVRLLRSWKSSMRAKEHKPAKLSPDAAMRAFEGLRERLLAGAGEGAKARLPWD